MSETRLPDRVLRALEPMPAAYADLLRSVVHLLAARREVRAVWLSGSVGREAADAGSDLDVSVTVEDAAFDDLADPGPAAPGDGGSSSGAAG